MVVEAPQLRIDGAKAVEPDHRSWLLRVLPFVVWQILAILLVELVLSWAGLGEEEIFKLDPVLGTRHMVNKRITWRTEGFAQSYLDADGMREPGLTVSKPAHTYRIALMGDSIVEGLQVPIGQTFGQILERRLNQSGGQRVQVLNFGTSGYSTCQEYLQLKRQVLKYKPDLVVLGYNNRDMFENWSAPDQVISNVRPYALHLPGQHLVIDSTPVKAWMRSPRARFLMALDWFRQHSRIYGLWSALDLEWSFHNPFYRCVITLFTSPRKAFLNLVADLTPKCGQRPAFEIQKFENTHPADTRVEEAKAQPVREEFVSVAPRSALEKGAKALQERSNAKGNTSGTGSSRRESSLMRGEVRDPRDNYIRLVTRTMGSLLNEMQKESTAAGSGFAVVTVPVRAALCPVAGLDTAFMNVDYPQEIKMLAQVCDQYHIPMFDCEAAAAKLTKDDQTKLFYAVHLTPDGHKFLAGSIYDFIQSQMQLSHSKVAHRR